jgi:hypothetical protein
MERRQFTAGLAAAMLATATGRGALAQAAAGPGDGRRRVNLAARQAMLGQQILKSAAFAALGVTPAAQRSYLEGSAELFDRTLTALRRGSRGLELEPEAKTKVLLDLVPIERVWTELDPAIGSVLAAGAIEGSDVEALLVHDAPLLEATQRFAGAVQRAYGGREIPLHIAVAINFAGRQRMLTQKMAKEYALVALGIAPDANRAAMAESVELFEASLNALANGYPPLSLLEPKQPVLRRQLGVVRTLWDDLAPTMRAATEAGVTPSRADLEQVAWSINPVLVQMNAAVFMFEDEI